nr:hypothetical protein [Tanacetum cinerariifolium]
MSDSEESGVTYTEPYAEDASPIAQSPEYVLESDLEAYPEEDDDEDPEEDLVDYPVDGGDDGDDEEREDRLEITLPPRKRLGIALGPGYEVGESLFAAAARPAGGLMADYGFVATMDREIRRDPKREVRYGITDSWDEIVETLQGAPVSTDTELGGYMREFETRVRRDTDEIYSRLDDEQTTYTDIDNDADTTGTGDHTTGKSVSPTGIGDSLTGTGYRTTGTVRTRWRSYTARATRGGW